MENIYKALFQAAGLLVFIVALGILIMCVKLTDEMSDSVTGPERYRYEYRESADFSYIKDTGGASVE